MHFRKIVQTHIFIIHGFYPMFHNQSHFTVSTLASSRKKEKKKNVIIVCNFFLLILISTTKWHWENNDFFFQSSCGTLTLKNTNMQSDFLSTHLTCFSEQREIQSLCVAYSTLLQCFEPEFDQSLAWMKPQQDFQ